MSKINLKMLFRSIKSLALVSVILISVFFLNKTVLDSNDFNHTEVLPINSSVLKHISFGYDNLLADYYWLASIQYSGERISNMKFPELAGYYKNIFELDPKFIYPYKICMFILGEYDPETAIKIGQGGMIDNLDEWSIPYYIAYVYAFVKNEPLIAANYYDLSYARPGSLESAKYLGAILRRHYGKFETAMLFWKHTLETSNDQKDIEKAKFEIKRLENLIYLNNAVKVYYEKFGLYPDNELKNLLERRVIDYIPMDPNREVIYLWDSEKKNVKIDVNF